MKTLPSYLLLLALWLAPGICSPQSVLFEESAIGDVYLVETFRDWQKLCVRTERQTETCHIYQLVSDENNHPTMEVSIVRILGEEGIPAGATITAPLETLLTEKLVLSLEEGTYAEYPYSWCDRRGCYVRVALSDDDIVSMKQGNSGTIEIRSASRPNQPLSLRFSFLGFSDAFNSL